MYYTRLVLRLCAIVPVKNLARGKSRLATLLSVEKRINLSIAMLRDVLGCLCSSPCIDSVIIVGSDTIVKDIAGEFNAMFVEDAYEQGVNSAVALADDIARRYDASVVLPHDIPLISELDVLMLYTSMLKHERCVVITPSSRLDGTNILLRRPPDVIKTHYDEDSYILHLNEALSSDVRLKILLSSRLMFDVDEPDDIYALMSSNHECNAKRYLMSIL
ncbi:MAG: 2-phospho-L-lactate guanylyltransferase [Candidatus Nitrosocaldus sp.]